MCDKLIKSNIPKNEIPQYVYKRVQKVGEGEYITPIMGEPIKFGVWKSAPIRKREKYSEYRTILAKLLKRKHKLVDYVSSSYFEDHHNGKWASFATRYDARNASMSSNYATDLYDNKYPVYVVKCQVGGEIHKAKWLSYDTYLSSAIKIVEEIEQTY